MNPPYEPVSCEFHDVLESAAVRRQPVAVVYRDDGGVQATVVDVITDVAAKAGEEFMTLQGGLSLRLDRLVSVDGVALADL